MNESTDANEEKTWNPDPDRTSPNPPDCFRQATDYWSTKFVVGKKEGHQCDVFSIRFLPHFQCATCLTYHAEPVNFTMATPLRAMTHTSLRDFPTFKNKRHSTEKSILGKVRKLVSRGLLV